jgi:cytochrome c oxidase assembly protein subunit 15
MVSSGLTQGVSVSQYRLAFHLTLASAIYAYILWTAQSLAPRASTPVPTRLRASAMTLLVLVLAQIYLGALVAGLHAGLIYNTWPLIDGSFIPDASWLFFDHPLWRNFFENTLTVQFDHRMVAYGLWLLALLHAFDAMRSATAPAWAIAVAAVVTVQAGLGIATLLYQAPLALALTHQATAIIVLTLASIHAQRLVAVSARAPANASAAVQPG